MTDIYCPLSDRAAMRAATKACKEIVRRCPQTAEFVSDVELGSGLAHYRVRYRSEAWTGRRYGPRMAHPIVWLHWLAVGIAKAVCPHRLRWFDARCTICGVSKEALEDHSWHLPIRAGAWDIGGRTYFTARS